MNPHNFESFTDPNGGEWIRITHKSAKDVVWRPTDINLTEDGIFQFDVEFLTGPGTVAITEENQDAVAAQINGIMTDILASEQADLEALAESEMEPEDAIQGVSDELLAHIEQNEVLAGGHKVSEAMLPQDVQGDLAQISSVLGGLKPQ